MGVRVKTKGRVKIDPNWILEAVEKSSEMGAEVRRVVNMANKRIARIENDRKVISPALKALKNQGIEKFTLRGSTWEQQKETYFRAIEYLNQETSTLGGSRKFTKEFIQKSGLYSANATPEQEEKYLEYAESIIEEYGDDVVNNDRLIYNAVAQYFYDMKVEQAQNAIEQGTMQDVENVDRSMREQAKGIAQSLEDRINSIIDSLEDF